MLIVKFVYRYQWLYDQTKNCEDTVMGFPCPAGSIICSGSAADKLAFSSLAFPGLFSLACHSPSQSLTPWPISPPLLAFQLRPKVVSYCHHYASEVRTQKSELRTQNSEVRSLYGLSVETACRLHLLTKPSKNCHGATLCYFPPDL